MVGANVWPLEYKFYLHLCMKKTIFFAYVFLYRIEKSILSGRWNWLWIDAKVVMDSGTKCLEFRVKWVEVKLFQGFSWYFTKNLPYLMIFQSGVRWRCIIQIWQKMKKIFFQCVFNPFLGHTASEPSGRVNSMNQHFWLQNIKIYHKNNKKCHFAKYSSLHEAIY